MRRSKDVAFAVAVHLLTVPGISQARATCRGVVRDATGAPIADAHVVASWQPDWLTLGERDRREATTGADGAFAFDLFVGYPYCVWAIGPMADDRSRPVAFPSFEATGGRTLDLVCTQRTKPLRLSLHGTTPWIREGPLALRVLIARDCPVGPDIPIPGDGPIPLPPLPNDVVTACLVDGRRQLLDSASIDLTATTSWQLAEPHAFDIVAETREHAPVVGAHIVQPSYAEHGLVEPIPGQPTGLPWRVIATTDELGHARGLVTRVRGTALLFAISEGASSEISGWVNDNAVEGGRHAPRDNGDLLHFAMHPTQARTVRVLGQRDDESVTLSMTGHLWYTAPNRLAQLVATKIARSKDGIFASTVPSDRDPLVRVTCIDDQEIPRRTVALAFGRGANLPDIDLALQRTVPLQVVDDSERPVPFAHLGATDQSDGFSANGASLVTDGQGNAELRLPDKEFRLYATTPTAHGSSVVPASGSDPVRLRLTAFTSARVRVVDASGSPVAGAHLEFLELPHPGEHETLLGFATSNRADLLAGLRTDADGEVTVRCPVEFDGRSTIRAAHGGVRSAPTKLAIGASPTVLRLRD